MITNRYVVAIFHIIGLIINLKKIIQLDI